MEIDQLEQGSAAAVALRAELKTKLEARMLTMQAMLAFLGLAFVAAYAFGGLLLFLYFLRHQFNPGGISAGDTVLMVLFSFGFVATLAIGLGFATVAGLPVARMVHLIGSAMLRSISWIHRNQQFQLSAFIYLARNGLPISLQWNRRDGAMLAAGCFCLLFFIFGIARGPMPVSMYLFTMLITGCWLSMFVFGRTVEVYGVRPPSDGTHSVDIWIKQLPHAKRTALIAAAVAGAITLFNIGTWQDASVMAVGFRKHDVSVRLAKEDFEIVIERAARSGIAVNPCEVIGPDSSTLHHADILWQNLGTKALLRFPTQTLGSAVSPRTTIRIEPNNSSIIVVSGGTQIECAEFFSEELFQGESERIKSSAANRLKEQLGWLREMAPGWKVRVTAHGSNIVIAEKSTQGSRSLRQALAIKELLRKEFTFDPTSIVAVGAEGTLPKRECAQLAKNARGLCEKLNRRVEISLFNPD